MALPAIAHNEATAVGGEGVTAGGEGVAVRALADESPAGKNISHGTSDAQRNPDSTGYVDHRTFAFRVKQAAHELKVLFVNPFIYSLKCLNTALLLLHNFLQRRALREQFLFSLEARRKIILESEPLLFKRVKLRPDKLDMLAPNGSRAMLVDEFFDGFKKAHGKKNTPGQEKGKAR